MTGPRRASAAHGDEYGMNYAAIGATLRSEVLSYPPEGFRATEFAHRLGSGAARFDSAGRTLMTWGALAGAGLQVGDVCAERIETAQFLRDQARGLRTGPLFLSDGTPWITPGMTATLRLPVGKHELRAPVKVICVFDEPGRIGYVWGTCPEAPVQMEQLILLQHCDDDTVRVSVRTMVKPPSKKWGLAMRLVQFKEKDLARRIMTALHPSHTATQPIEIQRAA